MNKNDFKFIVCAFLQVISIAGICFCRVDISIYLMLMAIYIQLVMLNTKG